MPTTRETVLAALQARLQPVAALVLRDDVLPERIPAAGLIILRDGQPGEPEVTLSPLRYHYQHRAELEVVVQAGTGRASAFDTLIAAIGTTLEIDRTLGGLCDWVEPEAPASVDLPIEGAAALKAAIVTVVLHYTTNGPWPDTSVFMLNATRQGWYRSDISLIRLTIGIVAEQPQEQAGKNRREEDAEENPAKGTAASRFCHSGGQQDENPQGEIQGCQPKDQEEKAFNHGATPPSDGEFWIRAHSTGAIEPARIAAILGCSA